MPGVGELAALATAVCWSFTAILFTVSGRLVGSRVVNRSRLLFAVVILGGIHALLYGSVLPAGAGAYRWGWLALSSVLGFVIGDASLFQAFVLIGPRLGTLMMSTVPVQSTLLGWLFLGETVSRVEIAGIAWVVSEREGARSTLDAAVFRRGLLLGLIGAFGQATNLLTAKYGLAGGFPPISATVIRLIVAVLVMWTVAALQRQVRPTVAAWRDRRALAAILGGTVAGPVTGVSLSMLAIQNARLGIASTLMALPPVLLIPIEFVLFGRRITRRSAAGTVLAFVGVALILARR